MGHKLKPDQETCSRSSPRAIVVFAAIAIGLIPMAWFGWKGIITSFCLMFAGLFFVYNKRGLAAFVFVLWFIGEAVIYPVMDPARGAILRSDCARNIRELTIAIHEYESANGCFPPPWTTDQSGRRLHSWRVLILPYIGQKKLYDQIDLTRLWDDPVNQPFHDQMPAIFCCASLKYHSKWRTTGNTTNYVVVVGEHTAWPEKGTVKSHQIPDSTSRTVAIIESESHRIPWMSPRDPKLADFLSTFSFEGRHGQNINVSTIDGSTRPVWKDQFIRRQFEYIFTIDDGKSVLF